MWQTRNAYNLLREDVLVRSWKFIKCLVSFLNQRGVIWCIVWRYCIDLVADPKSLKGINEDFWKLLSSVAIVETLKPNQRFMVLKAVVNPVCIYCYKGLTLCVWLAVHWQWNARDLKELLLNLSLNSYYPFHEMLAQRLIRGKFECRI